MRGEEDHKKSPRREGSITFLSCFGLRNSMWGRGKVYGLIIIILVLLLAATSWWYTQELAEQREARIAALLATPEYAHCLYDASTCPQLEQAQIPNLVGIAMVLIALVLGFYLWRSDKIQQDILKELRQADQKEQGKRESDLVLSVLKTDERKVINAIKEQPGIAQNTLRLRTDFSKAKLSNLLKELESRGLVVKEQEGKTNKLHLKRKL
jgi:uncharacterized membrane protein